MRTLELPRRAYNSTLLTIEMQTAVGAYWLGMTGRVDDPGLYDANLSDDAPLALDAQIIAIAQAHDASRLTPEQQADAERQADLDPFNMDNAQAALSQMNQDITTLSALPDSPQKQVLLRTIQRQQAIIRLLMRVRSQMG